MDPIDKTSIAVLAIYIFGVCLVGFYGVFKTLRNSRLGGGKAQARSRVQGVRWVKALWMYYGTIRMPSTHSPTCASLAAAEQQQQQQQQHTL
jgi:hypothetical protein